MDATTDRPKDTDTSSTATYVPVAAVFRDRGGELHTTSFLDPGPLVSFLQWLASGEPTCDGQVPADGPGWATGRDEHGFQALREQMEADGCELIFVALLNDDDHARVLAHSDIDDLESFILRMAADVAEGEMHDLGQ